METNGNIVALRRKANSTFGIFATSGAMFLLSAVLHLRSPQPGMPLILGLLGAVAGVSLMVSLLLRVRAMQAHAGSRARPA